MTHPIVTPTSDPGGWVAVANARVPPGYVRLSCDDPPLDVLALLGEGPPRPTRAASAAGTSLRARSRSA
jgi:hypothetical protein